MTQTEIDQRETARVEAILQVAKWALAEAVEQNGDGTTRCVHYLTAVQHDDPGLADDTDLRCKIVMRALDDLASGWDHLAEGERDVVLAGIVGPGEPFHLSFDWRDLVFMANELATWARRADEPDMQRRVQRERQYASLLRTITGLVVSA